MSNTKTPIIHPYLFFSGRCEEAIEFYRKALGAEVGMIMRFKDSPEPTPPGMLAPGWENKVMHGSISVGSNIIMLSDGCGKETGGIHGFSLSLAVADEAAAKRAFDALADGGKVEMPLTKTFWSPCFGMLEDRFGIGWMVSIAQECGNK